MVLGRCCAGHTLIHLLKCFVTGSMPFNGFAAPPMRPMAPWPQQPPGMAPTTAAQVALAAKPPKPQLPPVPVGPPLVLQQLQPQLSAGQPAACAAASGPVEGITAAAVAVRGTGSVPRAPATPADEASAAAAAAHQALLHPSLQPQRKRGRPRTRGVPALPPGQLMTLEEALKVGAFSADIQVQICTSACNLPPQLHPCLFQLTCCIHWKRVAVDATDVNADGRQVPPPPGVRPWNWRRQQARAVARAQAMAAAQANGGRPPKKKTDAKDGGANIAAEALFMAAEQNLTTGAQPGVSTRRCVSVATAANHQTLRKTHLVFATQAKRARRPPGEEDNSGLTVPTESDSPAGTGDNGAQAGASAAQSPLQSGAKSAASSQAEIAPAVGPRSLQSLASDAAGANAALQAVRKRPTSGAPCSTAPRILVWSEATRHAANATPKRPDACWCNVCRCMLAHF